MYLIPSTISLVFSLATGLCGSHFSQSIHLLEHDRYLVEEGRAGYPKMMSIGLHCRLARPGRVHGLSEFLDFAKSYSRRDVWFCTREQIADYWYENHFPIGASQTLAKGGPTPSDMAAECKAEAEAATTTTEESAAEIKTEEAAPAPAEEEGDII